MRFNTKIPAGLKAYFDEEISHYKTMLNSGLWQNAWAHLENAHVLGQQYPLEHTYVHWEMLKFGWRIKSAQVVIGQVPRLLFGGIKSFVGRVPVGNTGGANVPMLKPLPIREDLGKILSR